MVLISIFVFKYNCINIRVVIFYKKKIKKIKVLIIIMVLLIKRVLCLFYLLILIINYSINKSCLYMYC